jgi:hypothetical protein
MNHKILQCIHGTVVAQCRCIGPHEVALSPVCPESCPQANPDLVTTTDRWFTLQQRALDNANLREHSDELVGKLDFFVSGRKALLAECPPGVAEAMEMAAARIRQLEDALRACRGMADKVSADAPRWVLPNEIAMIVSQAVKA